MTAPMDLTTPEIFPCSWCCPSGTETSADQCWAGASTPCMDGTVNMLYETLTRPSAGRGPGDNW